MRVRERETGGAVIKDSRGPSCDRMASGARGGGRREPRRHVIRHVSTNRCGAGESRGMATIAVGGSKRVIVVQMAGGASRRRRGHVRAGQREPGRTMIESCRGPIHCRMADRAIRRSERRSRGGVHRVIRPLPGRQMALRVSAIGRGDGQRVIAIDMAGGACQTGVAIGQRETGRAMVECRRQPTGSIVAGRASRNRESGRTCSVRRIICLLPRQ